MAFFRLEDQEVYDIDNCVHKGEKVLLLEDEVIVGYTGFIDIGNFLFDDLERKTALMHVNSDIHLDFRIKDDYQGKGYGMLLLTKTIEEVKKSGFDAYLIECAREGEPRRFYDKTLGSLEKDKKVEDFRRYKKHDNENGKDYYQYCIGLLNSGKRY